MTYLFGLPGAAGRSVGGSRQAGAIAGTRATAARFQHLVGPEKRARQRPDAHHFARNHQRTALCSSSK